MNTPIYLSLALLSIFSFVSCMSNNKNDEVCEMEMMEYVTSKNDTIMIPRNVADYNRFLADSFEYRDNIVTELCAMLESFFFK